MTEQRLVITQGQQAVSKHPDVVLSTLLGSCVAVCLTDKNAKIGGLNHILLARQKGGTTHCDREGINAMELLINAIVKQGGHRDRLVAKVFGGAKMVDGLSGIGAANTNFVLSFLQREGVRVEAKSIGGTAARHLMFWPVSGVVKLKTVAGPGPTEICRTRPATGNGIELF